MLHLLARHKHVLDVIRLHPVEHSPHVLLLRAYNRDGASRARERSQSLGDWRPLPSSFYWPSAQYDAYVAPIPSSEEQAAVFSTCPSCLDLDYGFGTQYSFPCRLTRIPPSPAFRFS